MFFEIEDDSCWILTESRSDLNNTWPDHWQKKTILIWSPFWSFCFVWITLNYSKIIAVQTSSLPAIIYSVTCDIILLIFFRWRRQKAFFTRHSVGSHGCRGISCKEFLPVLSSFPCCCVKHDLDTYPLKMSELKPVTPEYANNIAIDSWRLNSSSRSTPPFAVISLGSLSTRDFETRTASGSELFSLITRLHTSHLQC